MIVESSRENKTFSTYALIAIAIVLLGWNLISFHSGEISIPALFVMGLMALALELMALRLPSYGFASTAFFVYLAALVAYGAGPAALVAMIALLPREIFIHEHRPLYRASSYFSSLFTVLLPASVYRIINQGAEPMSIANVIATCAAVALYFGADWLAARMEVQNVMEAHQKEWMKTRDRIRLFNLAVSPLGFAMALMIERNALLSFLFVIPGLAFRFAMDLGLRESAQISYDDARDRIIDLERLVDSVKKEHLETKNLFKQKSDELSYFYEMGSSLAASLNLDNILDIAVSIIQKIIPFQSCAVFLVTEGGITTAKCVSPHKEQLEYSSLLQLEEPVVQKVIQTKKALLINDAKFPGERRIFKDENSCMCVPFLVLDQAIGALYVGAKNIGEYSRENLQVLTMLANAAAIAIRTSQLYDAQETALKELRSINVELDSKIHQLSALFEMGQDLSNSMTLEDTLKIITSKLEGIFKFQSCAIFALSQDSQSRRAFSAIRYVVPYISSLDSINLSADDQANILGWMAYNRKPLLLDDIANSKLQVLFKDEQSIMAAPLITENEVSGALYIGALEPGSFDYEQLKFLSTAANQSALAIQNASLFEHTAKLAITDGLTGLYTHRYFQERLKEEILHSERYKRNISLLMVDTDHFKEYNDTQGHPEGDKALKVVADLLRSQCRKSDIVCRYGGDEFAIILKECNIENSRLKAERVRRELEVIFRSHPVHLTASIGVATYPDDAVSGFDLISSADKAMYYSKKTGKNRIAVASEIKSGPAKKSGSTAPPAAVPKAAPRAESAPAPSRPTPANATGPVPQRRRTPLSPSFKGPYKAKK